MDASMSRARNIQLIVNADDFGYSPAISRGILACAKAGRVTATGILGNASDIDEAVAMLAEVPQLEAGVHLVLSYGVPVTEAMLRAMDRFGGKFLNKFTMAFLISVGKISPKLLYEELFAQVDSCAQRGVAIKFLNSHEHLHMHPVIFPLVLKIADAFGIRWVRRPQADLVGGSGLGGRTRQMIVRLLSARLGLRMQNGIRMVGLAKSGRIDLPYLEKLFERMKPGYTYELMCHPGYFDGRLADGAHLKRYHDWDLERRTLQSAKLVTLLEQRCIRLIRHSDLLDELLSSNKSARGGIDKDMTSLNY
jgi:predicted glycoside hydrolase/deacetylase ChbG (UPF0249 family)